MRDGISALRPGVHISDDALNDFEIAFCAAMDALAETGLEQIRSDVVKHVMSDATETTSLPNVARAQRVLDAWRRSSLSSDSHPGVPDCGIL